MSRRAKLIGTLAVFQAVVLNYLSQISKIPSDVVAKWTLHDWVGSALYVILAGIVAWKLVLVDPNSKPPGGTGGAA